jgi:hypothetical protein
MMSKTSPSRAIRTILVLIVLIGVLFAEITVQASIAQADSHQPVDGRVGTRTPKPEKATRTPKPSKTPVGLIIWVTPVSHMLCGELVYINSFTKIKPVESAIEPTVSVIGLRRCDGKGVLIFQTRPRDLIQFFQFRDAEIVEGSEICTKYYGCLNRYITTFQNYIGLESCDACGVSMLPATWTQAPLTPYTPTPIPPTRTPWPTPESPTPSPTLSPIEVTPTLEIFELLQGTETSTPSITEPVQPTMTGSATSQAPLPTFTTTPAQPFYRKLGPAGIILLVVLALLIPLAIVLRDYLREK